MVDAGLACLVDQPLEQVVRAVRALGADDRLQGIEPLAGLLGVGVVGSGSDE